MFTLCVAGSGGDDWIHVARTLLHLGPTYYYMFMVYIVFFLFVVTNILTSLFVDHAMRSAHQDDSSLIADHMENIEELVCAAHRVFHPMEKDEEGNVSVEEFQAYLSSKQMVAFAARLDIETTELLNFFRMASDNGKHAVDLETFVHSCIKLRGTAKSTDLMLCLHEQAKIRKDVNHVKKQREEDNYESRHRSDSIWHALQRLDQSIAAHTGAISANKSSLQQLSTLVHSISTLNVAKTEAPSQEHSLSRDSSSFKQVFKL